MKPVPPGLAGSFAFTLGQEDTAQALGNPGVAVVSTVALILRIEEACYRLIGAYYEAGDATVGTKVAVDHLAPAKPDVPISIAVSLPENDGRAFDFTVEVTQQDRTVMRGGHQRRWVSLDRFLGETPETENSPPPEVEFWFDLHSPWCYPAAHRIGDIVRRHEGRLRWRPVHLAKLIDCIDGRRPLEANAAFLHWYRQDLADSTAQLGLPLKQHPDYPLRPSRAQRACLYAEETGYGEAYAMALLRAYWSEAADITDPALLEAVAVKAGLDPAPIRAVIESDHYKQALAENLEEAVAKDLFGLPAAVFQDTIYWGNDRLDLLDQRMGQAAKGLL